MSDPTYLIDTNILIGLEDDGEISAVMATLNRDKNAKRKKITPWK